MYAVIQNKKNIGADMKSIWQKDVKLPTFPKLRGKRKTDVLIIGGGITGILTAHMLRQNNIDCILLEKNRICEATTAGTTAKITFGHSLIYHKLIKKYGIETASGYLEANRLAFNKLTEIAKKCKCDFEKKSNFVYSLNSVKKIEKEIKALEKIGIKADFCDQLPLPFKVAGAVKIPDQAQFHPLKMIAEIAHDLPIYEHTFVKGFYGNRAITDYGNVIADNIIIATHFPFINKHGSYFLKLYQSRSYITAFEHAQNVNGMYVDESGKGFSFRNYNNYLLIGGEAHRTGKHSKNWKGIQEFAHKYYPDSKEVCSWAAQDCMSLDGIPYIGNYSKRTPRLWTASGFNKWGMTGSMLSALLLSDFIQEKKSPYEKIFSPSRSILKPQLFINGFETIKNFMTFTGKRCPHMGCSLKWNDAENSWDCPCHGSRFEENGDVINNPANKNLET